MVSFRVLWKRKNFLNQNIILDFVSERPKKRLKKKSQKGNNKRWFLYQICFCHRDQDVERKKTFTFSWKIQFLKELFSSFKSRIAIGSFFHFIL